MKIVRVVLTFLLLATFAGMAGAEDWPTRRLRIVVPFPAGLSADCQRNAAPPHCSMEMPKCR